MARRPERHTALNANVFINCPFDDDYRACFEAILFTVTMAGYQVRCALEEDDSGDVRFDKLCKLIAEAIVQFTTCRARPPGQMGFLGSTCRSNWGS